MPQGKARQRRGATYHHRDLRRALIAATLALVAEKGPTGFSMREAARRVGVTHAAPYRHFANRAALLAAVAVEGFQKMRRTMKRACKQATPRGSIARFEALGHAYVRFAVNYPSHFRVMYAEESDEAPGEALRLERDATFGLLVEEIEACQRQGLVRRGDPVQLALPAWAIVHGLSSLLVDRVARLAKSRRSIQDQAQLVTRALFEGLRSST